MLNILKSSIMITVSLISIFILSGILIGKINNKTNSYLNYIFGRAGLTITGFIGVPVHELSHYIFAKLFNHNITDMKLYRPSESRYDGVLGYVNHTYNKNSLFQKIGNFFIGVAPIIVGSFIVMLSFNLLLPNLSDLILSNINLNIYNNSSISNLANIYFLDFFKILKIIILNIPLTNIRFWIFFILSFSIISNMTLSSNDLKGCYSGITSIFIMVVILNIIFSIVEIGSFSVNTFLFKWNIILGFFISFIILFSLINLSLIYLLYRIKNII